MGIRISTGVIAFIVGATIVALAYRDPPCLSHDQVEAALRRQPERRPTLILGETKTCIIAVEFRPERQP